MKIWVEEGNLKIYSKESKYEKGPDKFYWKTAEKDAEYGPFDSVYAATKDYTKQLKTKRKLGCF
jgi:hypothetical protein